MLSKENSIIFYSQLMYFIICSFTIDVFDSLFIYSWCVFVLQNKKQFAMNPNADIFQSMYSSTQGGDNQFQADKAYTGTSVTIREIKVTIFTQVFCYTLDTAM